MKERTCTVSYSPSDGPGTSDHPCTTNRNQDSIQEELNSEGQASGVEREQDEDVITDPWDPTSIDILTKNPSVDNLIKRIEYNEINLTPNFQRKAGIWSRTRQSILIESLLLNIPLSGFYVASDIDGNWTVVDGLQRLTTIKRFIIDKTFILKGLEFLKQYEGKTFTTLPRPMQRRILESEPVFHIIQPSSPKDVTRSIFKRINTGGMPLSAQEIRNALYQGPATTFLKDLSGSQSFLQATDNSINDDRMADQECILRYLSFSIKDFNEYQPDLDRFLSKTMEELNEMDEKTLDRLSDKFYLAMDRAYQIFGDLAFRKQQKSPGRKFPINKALFETFGVTLGNLNVNQAECLLQKRDELVEQFTNVLMSDQEFVPAISTTTGSVSSVKIRFERIRELIRLFSERSI